MWDCWARAELGNRCMGRPAERWLAVRRVLQPCACEGGRCKGLLSYLEERDKALWRSRAHYCLPQPCYQITWHSGDLRIIMTWRGALSAILSTYSVLQLAGSDRNYATDNIMLLLGHRFQILAKLFSHSWSTLKRSEFRKREKGHFSSCSFSSLMLQNFGTVWIHLLTYVNSETASMVLRIIIIIIIIINNK